MSMSIDNIENVSPAPWRVVYDDTDNGKDVSEPSPMCIEDGYGQIIADLYEVSASTAELMAKAHEMRKVLISLYEDSALREALEAHPITTDIEYVLGIKLEGEQR